MSQTNRELGLDRGTLDGPPGDQLELYDRVIRSTASDDYLQSLGLGLGYYDQQERWQQIERYRRGLFADAAFGRRIIDRAIEQTKHGLAEEEWEALSDEERAEKDRRRFMKKVGEERWNELPSPGESGPNELDQLEALEQHTGLSQSWTPNFWKVMEFQHDISRSQKARLMDNLFSRVKELRHDGDKKPQGFLRRGGKQ